MNVSFHIKAPPPDQGVLRTSPFLRAIQAALPDISDDVARAHAESFQNSPIWEFRMTDAQFGRFAAVIFEEQEQNNYKQSMTWVLRNIRVIPEKEFVPRCDFTSRSIGASK